MSSRQVVIFVNALGLIGAVPVFLGIYTGPAWLILIGFLIWAASITWVALWARRHASSTEIERANAARDGAVPLAFVVLNLAAVAVIVAGGPAAIIGAIDGALMATIAFWMLRQQRAG